MLYYNRGQSFIIERTRDRRVHIWSHLPRIILEKKMHMGLKKTA